MKYIFEPQDIKAGLLIRQTFAKPLMIMQQHLSNAESLWSRRFAIVDLTTGDVTSPWMTAEDLSEYLTGGNTIPLSRDDVFIPPDE